MQLTDMTVAQLERLYHNAHERMRRGTGYQMFGYDWRTLEITRPGWYVTLRDILEAWLEVRRNSGVTLQED